MSDNIEKNGQMTFGFFDVSEDGTSGDQTTGGKVRDDMTPGLFDPELSEEEEMDAFLRKLHSESRQEEKAEAEEPRPDFSFDSSKKNDPAAGPEQPEPEQPEPEQPEPEQPEPEQPEPEQPEPEQPEEKKILPPKKRELTRKDLKRAALAFLASLEPSGIAMDVAAKRCRAGAAAFWMEKGTVTRTAVAEVHLASDILSLTGEKSEQFNALKLARLEKEMLEQEIRRSEPGLRDSAMLFSDFEHWNYEASENPAYKECVGKIRQLEHALYHGSRLERLMRAQTASELYLVVPENAVAPDFPICGWGLVYVGNDLSFELIRKPDEQANIPRENQLRLALGIAGASLPDVLFAGGIRPDSSGKLKCGPLPRRRHL